MQVVGQVVRMGTEDEWVRLCIDQLTCHVLFIFVDIPLRNQGRATRLLIQAETWAQANGATSMELENSLHLRNSTLYTRQGYMYKSNDGDNTMIKYLPGRVPSI